MYICLYVPVFININIRCTYVSIPILVLRIKEFVENL